MDLFDFSAASGQEQHYQYDYSTSEFPSVMAYNQAPCDFDLNMDQDALANWDPQADPLGTTLPPATSQGYSTAPLDAYDFTTMPEGTVSMAALNHYEYEYTYNNYTEASLPLPVAPQDYDLDMSAPPSYLEQTPDLSSPAPYPSSTYAPSSGYDSSPSPSLSYTEPVTPTLRQAELLVCDYPNCPRGTTPFSRPCDLNKHRKTHEKNHLCTMNLPSGSPCEQRFATSKDLKRHQNSGAHGAQGDYVCPHCNCRKSRLDNLKDHMRRKHRS
jgi:hypothetical protein